jgi:signal peptidase I
MFDKWLKYSYAAQKTQRHRLRRVLIWLLAFYVLYNLLTGLAVSVKVLENDAMQPALRAGDRLVFSSFTIYSLLPESAFLRSSPPFRRGNIVLVDTALGEKRPLLRRFLDQGLRFFTAQRLSLWGGEEHLYVRRVIGLPGDEVSMTNFVFRVKPADGVYGLTEYELSDRDYKPDIPQVPALWDESLPFSGTMDKIVLGDDECFLIADDRSSTNDSRSWGPVKVKLVAGKLLFRFWPPARFGWFL